MVNTRIVAFEVIKNVTSTGLRLYRTLAWPILSYESEAGAKRKEDINRIIAK